MKRIGVGGLHTECSSYSPLEQRAEDFTRCEGAALLAQVPVNFAALGLDPVPIFHDRSVPGGPVPLALYEAQKRAFLDRLTAAGPLDGALLLMHGAYFVPGLDDPEGDFIAAVRAALGPEALLAASFDLHGQMTARIAATLDAFAAYRTAPHIDVGETHARAARMLAEALAGGPRPSVHWAPVPLLVSGEMSATAAEPCRGLYADLAQHDARPGVRDANLMIGYVWADSPRATAAAVVTATDPIAGRETAAQIAAAYWGAREKLGFNMTALPLAQALARALAEAPAILADSGDNPTAGGVGDRADVLAALIAAGAEGALVASIADPPAYAALAAGADTIALGGSLGGGGPRLTITPRAVTLHNGLALIHHDGLQTIVTAHRRPFHHRADFTALGIDPTTLPLLAVKSGYLVPEIDSLPQSRVMALTPGAVSQNLPALPNIHRPRNTVLLPGI